MQPPQEKNIVETICRLAVVGDKSQLKELLTSHCVGEYVNGTNAIIELASRGEEEAVYLLIREFHANPNFAVIGAARGGRLQLMNQLLASGARYEYALAGAVLGNRENLTDHLLQRGSINLNFAVECATSKSSDLYDKLKNAHNNFHDDNEYRSAIYGTAKHPETTVEKISQMITESNDVETLLDGIAGAAMAGNIPLFTALMDHPYNTYHEQTKIYEQALFVAAYRDSTVEIDSLSEKIQDKLLVKQTIVGGAAYGGKIKRLTELLRNNPHDKLVLNAAQFAASAGH